MASLPAGSRPGWHPELRLVDRHAALAAKTLRDADLGPEVVLRTDSMVAPSKQVSGSNLTARLELPALYIGSGGGSISFSWNIDSEKGADKFRFYVDGVEEKIRNGAKQAQAEFGAFPSKRRI